MVTLPMLLAILRFALAFVRLAKAWPKASRLQRVWMIVRLLLSSSSCQ